MNYTFNQSSKDMIFDDILSLYVENFSILLKQFHSSLPFAIMNF
jgi:hypothetical protein